MKNLAYLLALHSVDGLGPIRLKIILDFFEDPRLAWEADSRQLKALTIPQNVVDLLFETRKKLNPESYLGSIKKDGIGIVTIFDDDYPERLREIYDPPTVLYYKGQLPAFPKSIAVVGTRKITGYGRLVTEKFASYLSQNGLVIVSGLARGVDTIAHQSAVDSDGQTIAVLGGGINKIFPPENSKLAETIAEKFGAVVSEFPPNHPSLPGNFPARNRIISGLSLAVLVTEAAEDSGSLITARLALDQGREVMAVPGPVTSDLSQGPAMLIKQGARLVSRPEEVLEELGLSGKPLLKVVSQDFKLSELEKKVLEGLQNEEKHIDELCRDLSLAISELSACLVKMELLGLIKNLGGGNYSRT